jgi:tetratricopeptide (TPR) repeat protein
MQLRYGTLVAGVVYFPLLIQLSPLAGASGPTNTSPNTTEFAIQDRARQPVRPASPLPGLRPVSDSTAARRVLATQLAQQGKYQDAERLYLELVTESEQTAGRQSLDVDRTLGELADVYRRQRNYVQAISVLKQCLDIEAARFEIAEVQQDSTFNALGSVYYDQKRYADAERAIRNAIRLHAGRPAGDQRETSEFLANLAETLRAQKKYSEAEVAFTRALALKEDGQRRPDGRAVMLMNNFGMMRLEQRKYFEAETNFTRALDALAADPDRNSEMAIKFNLAVLYARQSRYAQAEPLFREALAMSEALVGPDHPDTARILQWYALVVRKTKRKRDANALEKRAKLILSMNASAPLGADIVDARAVSTARR